MVDSYIVLQVAVPAAEVGTDAEYGLARQVAEDILDEVLTDNPGDTNLLWFSRNDTQPVSLVPGYLLSPWQHNLVIYSAQTEGEVKPEYSSHVKFHDEAKGTFVGLTHQPKE